MNLHGYTWGRASINESDWDFISSVLKEYNVRSVLEFGSGLSTCRFIDSGCDVRSFEADIKYYERIKQNAPYILSNVFFWDGVTDFEGKFDFAFVDGPAAWNETIGKRDVSTRIAAERADIVVTHDSDRPGECQWAERYLKPSFYFIKNGGVSCKLWIRKGYSEIIDIHAHASRVTGLTRADRKDRFPTPDELIESMNIIGINKAVVMSFVSPECQYCLITTEEVLSICEEFPSRLIPFMGIDARMLHNRPDSNFSKMIDHYKALGCKGVGEYTPNIPFDSELNINLFKQIEASGLPLVFHLSSQIGGTYGCYDDIGLPRLERVLKTCPTLTMIGHSPVFWSEISADVTEATRWRLPEGKVISGRLCELMREYPNLYGDLSALSGYVAISRDKEFGCGFLEEFADRLCFGSDIAKPFQKVPLKAYLTDLHNEGLITDKTYRKIMWVNASRLLGGN